MNRAPSDRKPRAPVVLHTERFTLRRVTRLQAWRATYPWTFDPDVMHPLGYPAGTWTRYAWYRRIKRLVRRRSLFFAIYPKDGGEMIGFEAARLSSPGMAFLTVVIGNREWWGRGVVQETRRAIIDYLFDQGGCRRVWGTPTARNFASIFNYQALGFAHEGVLRQHMFDHTTKGHVDTLIFGLLRDEWLARRAARSDPARPASTAGGEPAIRAEPRPEGR